MNRACKLMILPMALSLGVFSACSKDPGSGDSGFDDLGDAGETGTGDEGPMPDMGSDETDETTGDDPCDVAIASLSKLRIDRQAEHSHVWRLRLES